MTQAHAPLHGGEKAVLGDAGYQGVGKRPENADKAMTGTPRCARALRTEFGRERSRMFGKRGRRPKYIKAAIQFCLTVKGLFSLALRQAVGMAQSLLKLTGLDWQVPISARSADIRSIFR